MRRIQILLLVLTGVSGVLYFTRLRSRTSDRLIVGVIVSLGAVMIVLPDLTIVAAHWLGVGRGVDLVMYLFLVGLSFLVLLFQSHLRVVDARIVELVRTIAMMSAKIPGGAGARSVTHGASGREGEAMTRSIVVKQDIRARYDELGEAARAELASLRSPGRVWRLIEGERPALAYFRRRKLETALQLGGFPPHAKLVEVGCGTGDYSLLLARDGFLMTGVDLSSKSIDAACAKASTIGVSRTSFVVSDAETLSEVPENSADGVVSFSTLRYVPEPRLALRAIRRVLKPSGVAVLDFPNRFCPWFNLLKTHFGVERHIHDHHYSTREIVSLMKEAGFMDVTARRILFTTYVLPTMLLPLFRVIDWIGERAPGINQTAGIIMVKGRKA